MPETPHLAGPGLCRTLGCESPAASQSPLCTPPARPCRGFCFSQFDSYTGMMHRMFFGGAGGAGRAPAWCLQQWWRKECSPASPVIQGAHMYHRSCSLDAFQGFLLCQPLPTVSCVLPSPAPVCVYIYLCICVCAAGTFPVNTNKQSSLYLYTEKEALPACLSTPSWGRSWGDWSWGSPGLPTPQWGLVL